MTDTEKERPMSTAEQANVDTNLANRNPCIEWRDNTPYSVDYDDTYYSTQGGIAESEHVFISANKLEQRWSNLSNSTFVITELGFGSGINFLCSWKLWHRINPPRSRLHYIACEKSPLKPEDIMRVLDSLLKSEPTLENFTSSLLNSYHAHSSGYHRLVLCSRDRKCSVTLDLYYGDAGDSLQQLVVNSNNKIDSWFLDGFSPSKNPSMWDDKLFSILASLSKEQSTLSSYTVAGDVRRSLIHHGFKMEKIHGFGKKRNMLYGVFAGSGKPGPSKANSTATHETIPETIQATSHLTTAQNDKPWFHLGRSPHLNRKALVIGAGLAGSSTAYALAKRGYRVTVIDQGDVAASGASGNRQAALHIQLRKKSSTVGKYHLQSYVFSNQQFKSFQREFGKKINWSNCGVFCPYTSAEDVFGKSNSNSYSHYSTEIIHSLSSQQSVDKTGWFYQFGGDFYPLGGWLNPTELCEYYLSNDLISVIYSCEVDGIEREDDQWNVYTHNSRKLVDRAEIVILANSFQATKLAMLKHLPLSPIRGQVSYLAKTENTQAPLTIISDGSYVIPQANGEFTIGSTYNNESLDTNLLPQDQHCNVANLLKLAPHLHSTEIQAIGGRASVRCGTPDYLPMIGPVPHFEKFVETYRELGRNARRKTQEKGPYHSGLYINAGHGSNGLSSCPLAGEILSSMICDEPLPVQANVLQCINPARFLINDIKRQKYR